MPAPSRPLRPAVAEHDDANDDASDDVLAEYLAVVAKVDAAASAAFALASDAVVCARGCDACCAPGLSVLPVEAERLARHLEQHPPVAGALGRRADRCVFLDDDGACGVYEARPLLCRTHGLPLITGTVDEARAARGPLRVIDNASVCELNFKGRAPRPAEILDAGRILALLVTVDRRFRSAAGLPDDDTRVPLAALVE